ncbi:hypothetical protein [Jannaschia helgolandensis]|mgnify:FL=1|uniref:hypothetical protein n=1 Tax=Jannaschia helgolandensis TaxID=188906 RepID=UPI0030D6EAF0
MSDLYWLTDAQMERLETFFAKSHGKEWHQTATGPDPLLARCDDLVVDAFAGARDLNRPLPHDAIS